MEQEDFIMRKHIAVVLAILTFCEYPCSALCDSGAKPLTLQERVLCGALRGLQWKETLSDADRTNIVSALASPEQSISGLALTVATVHNEKDVLLSFKGQIGSEGSFVRPVAMRVVEELKNGGNPMMGLRRMISEYQNNAGSKVLIGRVARIAAIARHIIVIDQVRDLRTGKLKEPYALRNLGLTRAEEMLLKYGRLAAKDAETAVLKEIAGIKVASVRDYELMDVLASYEEPCINGVVTRLTTGEQVTEHEATVLLGYLSAETLRLTDAAKNSLHEKIEAVNFNDRNLEDLKARVLQKP